MAFAEQNLASEMELSPLLEPDAEPTELRVWEDEPEDSDPDTQVERALLRRALGYDYREERVEQSEKGAVKVVRTVKHVPGSISAQLCWLKNRRPDRWRDRPLPADPDAEGESAGGVTVIVDV